MRMRTAALSAQFLGGLASVALLLYAGRQNPSSLLRLLMSLWVVAPFVIFAIAIVASTGWPLPVRIALHRVTCVLALVSTGLYAFEVLRPFTTKAAFLFVAVPPLAGLLVVGVLAFVALRAPRSIATNARA